MRIFTMPPTVGSAPEPNFYDSLQKVRLRQQLEMYSLCKSDTTLTPLLSYTTNSHQPFLLKPLSLVYLCSPKVWPAAPAGSGTGVCAAVYGVNETWQLSEEVKWLDKCEEAECWCICVCMYIISAAAFCQFGRSEVRHIEDTHTHCSLREVINKFKFCNCWQNLR